MNNYRYLFLITFLLAVKVSAAQEVPKIRIDPAQAYGGIVSEYFESVEYIPLETTKESLFGYSSNLIVTDSSIVVLDNDTRSVLFFAPTGKFLRKVSQKGKYFPVMIYPDSENNYIFIGCSDASGVDVLGYNYDLHGYFVNGIKVSSEVENDLFNAVSLGNSYTAIYNRRKLSNLHDKTIKVHSYFTVHNDNGYSKPIIERDVKPNIALLTLTNELGSFRRPYVNKNTFYFSTPLEHIIYKVTKDTAIKLYQFIFPSADQVNKNLLNIDNRKQLDSIIEKKWFRDNTILSIDNIIVQGEKIFFMITTGGFGFPSASQRVGNKNFIYNTITGRLSALERITPDVSCYYLPILEPSVIGYSGVLYNKDYCYTHISSLQMFAAYERTKSKNPQYPPVLQQYFATQSRKSNPVIVRMKLKE